MVELTLPLKDQLYFYLVQESLKPCHYTQVFLSTRRNGTPHPGEEEKAKDFYKAIEKYKLKLEYLSQKSGKNRLRISFCAGKNQESLDSLLKALEDLDDRRIGLALGYPQDAVENYLLINNEIDRRFCHELKKAVQRKRTIPTWIAYLDHTPAIFDLMQQSISISSIEQAKEYMRYTRQHNEELAESIENNFHEVILKKLIRK
jgi:hypothetical protein